MLDFLSNINNKNSVASSNTSAVKNPYMNFRGINKQSKADSFVKSTDDNGTTTPIKSHNVSFKGGFKIPIEEVAEYNKKYLKSIESLSKEDIINDFCMTYTDGLKKITGKYEPQEAEYKEKSEFFKDYAHELYGSFIQAQQYKLLTLPEEATHSDVVKPMHEITKHVSNTLERYQYFIDKGLDNPSKTTPINKAWELTKECLEQKIKNKNITLNIENEDLMNDPSLITHYGYKNYSIMSNLLENATKYSPDNSKINATFETKDGNVHLIVKDHGRGILPEEQGMVLEGSGRGSNVQDISGTGHGLFRVSKILEEHSLPAPKITSPLYPQEPINKGTQIEVPLIHDKN